MRSTLSACDSHVSEQRPDCRNSVIFKGLISFAKKKQKQKREVNIRG